MSLYNPIKEQLQQWSQATPSPQRQSALEPLAQWIRQRAEAGRSAEIICVCTHNSRRSHISQIWAQAAAHHQGLRHVITWSGGTEATAFNPRAVRAMKGQGFGIDDTGQRISDENVLYEARYGHGLPSQKLFSKVYSDAANPQQDFAAIMVCDSADAACPVVIGADIRIKLPFVDPKRSDGTDEEAAIYTESCLEIGQTMAWLMRRAAG